MSARHGYGEARDIIAKGISGAPYPSNRTYGKVDLAIANLTAAGWRLVGPDEVDPVSIEKAAQVAGKMLRFADTTSEADIAITAAIRAIASGGKP